MPDILTILDAAFASSAARSGPHLACKPGCAQCCYGVFPVSAQDAARLRTGLLALSQTEPARAARVRFRVADSLLRLDPAFPGDPATGLLPDLLSNLEDASLDEARREEFAEAFDEFANDEPCPALDPGTLTCDLYAHRPTLCRTFGPPSRTEEGHLGHCELCFTEASQEEVVAAELDPRVPEWISISDQAFDQTHGTRGETLVAYALRGV